MTTFIQPPFWAQGYGRWLTQAGTPHVGVQFLDADPIVEPITLDDAKAWLRVTMVDAGEDAVIARLITAARTACETRTQRPIVAHVCDVFLDRIQAAGWITLPFAPVTAVSSVTITDLAGVAAVMDPATYLVDLASEPARIGLPTMGFWQPMVMRAFQAVAIRLTLGYAQPPEDLLQAMRLLLGHFYENRSAVQPATRFDAVLPLGVNELLAPYELVMVP
jgi:uncharacterized phiE125 gp8 family phage protein